MTVSDMRELGAVIALVLKASSPAPDPKDPSRSSKVKYVIDPKAKEEAVVRVKALLDRYPVYPELDLKLLKEAFC
jgi:glycine hydroxymethyltransferase